MVSKGAAFGGGAGAKPPPLLWPNPWPMNLCIAGGWGSGLSTRRGWGARAPLYVVVALILVRFVLAFLNSERRPFDAEFVPS